MAIKKKRKKRWSYLAEELLAVLLDLVGDAEAGDAALDAALQLVLVAHHLHLDLAQLDAPLLAPGRNTDTHTPTTTIF